jgi:uncharacterized protein YjbI with pentapeptide repeats
MMLRKYFKFLLWGLVPSFLIICFILFVISVYTPIPTTFNVVAKTEMVEFRNDSLYQFHFKDAYISGYGGEIPLDSIFSGSFRPSDSVKIIVERVGFGPLTVRLSTGQNKSTGSFYKDQSYVGNAGFYTEFYFDDIKSMVNKGNNFLIPFRADSISIGNDPLERQGTTAILRSGELQMLGESLLGKNFGGYIFPAGSYELHPGYQFEISEAKGDAHGFISVSEEPGFTLTYKQRGVKGIIVPPGPSVSFKSQGFPVYVSFVYRLLKDPFFKSLSMLFGVLAILAGFISVLFEYKSYVKSSEPVTLIFNKKKKKKNFRKAFLGKKISHLWFFYFLCHSVQSQELVDIEAAEIGKGFLRSNGETCYLITPAHVVDNYRGTLRLSSVNGKSFEMSMPQINTFEPDLAILSLNEDHPFKCPTMLEIPETEEINSGPDEGFLKYAISGSLKSIPIYILEKGQAVIVIQPKLSTDENVLRPGLSGSLLFGQVKGQLMALGMFQKLDKDDQKKGIVLQINDIDNILKRFFPPIEPTMDLATAQQILDRQIERKDGSMQAQVEAIEALIKHQQSFSNVDLSGISFKGANISNGNFNNARMHTTNLSQVKAENTQLNSVGLRFGNVSHSNFRNAEFTEVYAPFVLGQDVDFTDADLRKTNFFGADLRNAVFKNANLTGASFDFADLTGANFEGANLKNAFFNGSILNEVNFDNATIENMSIAGASSKKWNFFSPIQEKGLCWKTPKLKEEERLLWTVDLMETWPSDRYSTGYEFINNEIRWAFLNFGPSNLPDCSLNETELPVGYQSQLYGPTFSIRLYREYYQNAMRYQEIPKQVKDHLELLKMHLLPENNY